MFRASHEAGRSDSTPFLALAVVVAMGFGLGIVANGSPPPLSVVTQARVRDVLGVNSGARHSTVADIAQVAGWVRDYHRWYWFEESNDDYSFDWTEDGVTFHSLDPWYASLKQAGLGVLVSVEFAPYWSSSNREFWGNPYYTGDGTQPSHYAEHAEYMAQIAARWGRTSYQANDPRIETSDRITGLGYVDYLESYNEPDYWWWSPTFPAYKYAKMLQADYNGYGTTSSISQPLIGAKAADPSMGVVHGGLAFADTAYLDGIRNNLAPWQMPFDAVNFHIYSPGSATVGGKSPEAGPLVSSINTMKAWRDRYAPGRPLWITETGWDTHTDGTKRSKLWAPESSAANYLLRSLALAIANGVDKLFFYAYKDTVPDSTGDYQSSGLVRYAVGQDGEKKAGWYYLATAMSAIGDYQFERAERNGEGTPAIYSYLFNRPETGDKVAMIWARKPGSERDDGTTVANYRLYVPRATTATLIEPVKGVPTGRRFPLQLFGAGSSTAYVNLPVAGEKPLFVHYQPTNDGPTGALPPPGNAAANSSFEADLDRNGLPDGWAVPSWATPNVARSDATAQSGSYAMLHKSSAGPSYTVYQDVAVVGGRDYDFSGWVFIPYSTGSFGLALQLQPLNSSGRVLSTANLGQSFTTTTGGWVPVSKRVTMPTNAVKARVVIKVTTLKATIYLDDFNLVDTSMASPTPSTAPTRTATPFAGTAPVTATTTPTDTPGPTPASTSTPAATTAPTSTPLPSPTAIPADHANLLVNPDMEADSDGDGAPDGWVIPSWQLSHVGLSTERVRSGSRSLRHSSSGGDWYVVRQDVPAVAGGSYRLGGWVNIPALAPTSRFTFQVQALNRWSGVVAGFNILVGRAYSGPTEGWEGVGGSITMPPGTEKARILMRVENLRGTIYLDDLEFIPAEATVSALHNLQQQPPPAQSIRHLEMSPYPH